MLFPFSANPSVISSIGTVRKTSQLDTKSKEKGVKTLNTSSGEASSQVCLQFVLSYIGFKPGICVVVCKFRVINELSHII